MHVTHLLSVNSGYMVVIMLYKLGKNDEFGETFFFLGVDLFICFLLQQ